MIDQARVCAHWSIATPACYLGRCVFRHVLLQKLADCLSQKPFNNYNPVVTLMMRAEVALLA